MQLISDGIARLLLHLADPTIVTLLRMRAEGYLHSCTRAHAPSPWISTNCTKALSSRFVHPRLPYANRRFADCCGVLPLGEPRARFEAVYLWGKIS